MKGDAELKVLWGSFILALCIPVLTVYAAAVGIELFADWLSRKAEKVLWALLARA